MKTKAQFEKEIAGLERTIANPKTPERTRQILQKAITEIRAKMASAPTSAASTKGATAGKKGKAEKGGKGKKKARSIEDDCAEILKKAKEHLAAEKKRQKERRKEGLPPTLTAGETVKKAAKAVKKKVTTEVKKEGKPAPGDKTQTREGIISIVKTFIQSLSRKEAKEFFSQLVKELGVVFKDTKADTVKKMAKGGMTGKPIEIKIGRFQGLHDGNELGNPIAVGYNSEDTTKSDMERNALKKLHFKYPHLKNLSVKFIGFEEMKKMGGAMEEPGYKAWLNQVAEAYVDITDKDLAEASAFIDSIGELASTYEDFKQGMSARQKAEDVREEDLDPNAVLFDEEYEEYAHGGSLSDTVPEYFGKGRNIMVFGYQTRYFENCPKATALFERLVGEASNTIRPNKDGNIRMCAESIDSALEIENRAVHAKAADKFDTDMMVKNTLMAQAFFTDAGQTSIIDFMCEHICTVYGYYFGEEIESGEGYTAPEPAPEPSPEPGDAEPEETAARGKHIGFDALAEKVSHYYQKRGVSPQKAAQFGKETAAKVYHEQLANKGK